MFSLRATIISLISLGAALGQQRNGDMPARPSIGKPARGIHCADINRLDFRNLTIRSGTRTFVFKGGTATHSDSPSEPGQNRTPDWTAKIERDTVVQPEPGTSVRFLVIHDNHLTGSGWRYYISGYRCAEGALSEVFHRDGRSLAVDLLSSDGIDVSSLVGVSPTPAQEIRKRWSYIWDRGRSGYVLSPTSSKR